MARASGSGSVARLSRRTPSSTPGALDLILDQQGLWTTAVGDGRGVLRSMPVPGEYVGNPFLLIKFPAIAIGLLNAVVLERSAAWRAAREGIPTAGEVRRLGLMGGVSLASWLTAVTAGRMIGYW